MVPALKFGDEDHRDLSLIPVCGTKAGYEAAATHMGNMGHRCGAALLMCIVAT